MSGNIIAARYEQAVGDKENQTGRDIKREWAMSLLLSLQAADLSDQPLDLIKPDVFLLAELLQVI